jgi:hypothetical protein
VEASGATRLMQSTQRSRTGPSAPPLHQEDAREESLRRYASVGKISTVRDQGHAAVLSEPAFSREMTEESTTRLHFLCSAAAAAAAASIMRLSDEHEGHDSGASSTLPSYASAAVAAAAAATAAMVASTAVPASKLSSVASQGSSGDVQESTGDGKKHQRDGGSMLPVRSQPSNGTLGTVSIGSKEHGKQGNVDSQEEGGDLGHSTAAPKHASRRSYVDGVARKTVDGSVSGGELHGATGDGDGGAGKKKAGSTVSSKMPTDHGVGVRRVTMFVAGNDRGVLVPLSNTLAEFLVMCGTYASQARTSHDSTGGSGAQSSKAKTTGQIGSNVPRSLAGTKPQLFLRNGGMIMESSFGLLRDGDQVEYVPASETAAGPSSSTSSSVRHRDSRHRSAPLPVDTGGPIGQTPLERQYALLFGRR